MTIVFCHKCQRELETFWEIRNEKNRKHVKKFLEDKGISLKDYRFCRHCGNRYIIGEKRIFPLPDEEKRKKISTLLKEGLKNFLITIFG